MILSDAIAHYHALLESPSSSAPQCLEQLQEGMRRRQLTFGGRPLCGALRPHFITEEQYRLLERVCGTLMEAIYRLLRALPERPDWMEALDLSAAERELVDIDPGYDWVPRKCRLDSFLDGDSLQFVEYNAESPAGISYADRLGDLFESLQIMRRFRERFAARRVTISPHVEEVLLKAWADYGGRGMPRIAIVDYQGLPTATEFEMFCEFFRNRGMAAVVCDPRELEYSGGRLRFKDFEIDLVYRRVLVNEFLERLAEVRPLLEAYRDRAVCMVNSFRVKLVHKKMLFGLLTDESLDDFFSAAERAVIDRHVPWTRRVREGRVRRRGKEIDLCPYLLENRDQFVLKPNDEYGGKGIFIGWECAPAEWERGLKEALQGSYIAQEKVRVAKAVFPRVSERLEYVEQLVDLDPYIFDGRMHGCLTRLSETALCNVTSGGGQVPTFILSPR